MRVRVPEPQRTFLELDELHALMDAAAAQDPATGRVRPLPGAGETAHKVAEMLTRACQRVENWFRPFGFVSATGYYWPHPDEGGEDHDSPGPIPGPN